MFVFFKKIFIILLSIIIFSCEEKFINFKKESTFIKEENKDEIAIVGGGIAGLMCAYAAAREGYSISLFEKESDFMQKTSSFPIHLHSGAIYPHLPAKEISELLKESIIFSRELPEAIVKHPTIIALHQSDSNDPDFVIQVIKKNQALYQDLVGEDLKNKVFGDPLDYYKLYTKAELEELAKKIIPKASSSKEASNIFSLDDWAIPFAKSTDLDQIKFPVVIVREHLMSMTKAKEFIKQKLKSFPNVKIYLNTQITLVKQQEENLVELVFRSQGKTMIGKFRHVLNAAGEASGKIDDMMNYKVPRMREAKQAIQAKLESAKGEYWPESVVMAPRGGTQAMSEIVPLDPNKGLFQLLSTATDTGLSENGLSKINNIYTSHPELSVDIEEAFLGNRPEDDKKRKEKFIERISARHPRFKEAIPIKMLRGIVQILGSDPDNRAGSLIVYSDSYSAAGIVKATSAPYVALLFRDMLAQKQVNKVPFF